MKIIIYKLVSLVCPLTKKRLYRFCAFPETWSSTWVFPSKVPKLIVIPYVSKILSYSQCDMLALSKPAVCGHYLSNSLLKLLLFSAHISYGKGKYLNQTGFFLENLPRIIVYVIWRSTFTEFNWHKFSSMRYVFVKIFGLFWEWRKWPHIDPKMTPKMTKIQNFPNFHRFYAFFAIFR